MLRCLRKMFDHHGVAVYQRQPVRATQRQAEKVAVVPKELLREGSRRLEQLSGVDECTLRIRQA